MRGIRFRWAALALGLTICVAAVGWTAPALAERDDDFGRYHALVIGNNEYQHLPWLETAVNDARVVADLLRQAYGFEVKLLINAGRHEIFTALNDLRRDLTERDNLLIYYAGHGVLDKANAVGYWLPADAEAENDANWVPNYKITTTLKAMSARHVLVVADSCYSGTLVRNVPARLRTGAESDVWLGRMASKRSRTALVSGGLEPVADLGGNGHSVFARQFIEVLRSNRVPLDGQGLYDLIKRKVVVNAEQTPGYSNIRLAGHDGGDLLFIPLMASVEVATPPTPEPVNPAFDPRQLDLAYWLSIKDSSDRGDFEAYLIEFPKGTYAALARNRLDVLKPSETPPATSDQIEVLEEDQVMVVLLSANLRSEPSTSGEIIATLEPGTEVSVTGKVVDRNWRRVKLGARVAYVYSPLLGDRAAKPPKPPMIVLAVPRPPTPREAPWRFRKTFAANGRWVGDIDLRGLPRGDTCKIMLSLESFKFKKHFQCNQRPYELSGEVEADGTLISTILYGTGATIIPLKGKLWQAECDGAALITLTLEPE